MESPAAILILAADPAAARRWAAMIQPHEGPVWCGLGQMPATAVPDVMLVEGDLPGWTGQRAGDPGVIRLDGQGPADLCLPSAVTPRELQLACRLLAQIVRLRRQVRSTAEIRQQLAQQALSDPLTGLPNRACLGRGPARPAGRGHHRFRAALPGDCRFWTISSRSTTPSGTRQATTCSAWWPPPCVKACATTTSSPGSAATSLGCCWRSPARKSPRPSSTGCAVALPRRHRGSEGRRVTASAGFHLLSPSPALLPSPEALLTAADGALRQAKQQGRDRTVGTTENDE